MDEVRLLNATIAALAAMFLWLRFNDHRSTDRAWRWVRHLIVAAFSVVAIGSLEHYRNSSELTAAMWAWTVVCTGILTALWLSRGRRP